MWRWWSPTDPGMVHSGRKWTWDLRNYTFSTATCLDIGNMRKQSCSGTHRKNLKLIKKNVPQQGRNISFVPNPESNSINALSPLYFPTTLKICGCFTSFKENVICCFIGDLQNTATAHKAMDFVIWYRVFNWRAAQTCTVGYGWISMFEQVTKKAVKDLHNAQPDLKMDEAMRQMASAEKSCCSKVQFRKLFTVQNQSGGGRKKIWEMERLAGQAMYIAELAGWTHMKIRILFTVASASFFPNKNKRFFCPGLKKKKKSRKTL